MCNGRVTTDETRRERIRATRVLLLIAIFLVLLAATPSRVEGATSLGGSVSTGARHSAVSANCLESSVLQNDNFKFRFPSCWTLSKYAPGSMMSTVLAYLSNQRMHNPCHTKRTATGIVSSCGYPVDTLERGGVLVTVIEGGMPGWKITSEPGRHLLVDRHVARESVYQNPAGPLHATEEISILIDRGISDNFYDLEAFFRGPGVAHDQRLFSALLTTVKIE